MKTRTTTKSKLWYALHDEGMAWIGASRLLNALVAHKVIQPIGEDERIDLIPLSECTERELLKLRGVGRKGLSALTYILQQRHDLYLGYEPAPLKKWHDLNVNSILQ